MVGKWICTREIIIKPNCDLNKSLLKTIISDRHSEDCILPASLQSYALDIILSRSLDDRPPRLVALFPHFVQRLILKKNHRLKRPKLYCQCQRSGYARVQQNMWLSDVFYLQRIKKILSMTQKKSKNMSLRNRISPINSTEIQMKQRINNLENKKFSRYLR